MFFPTAVKHLTQLKHELALRLTYITEYPKTTRGDNEDIELMNEISELKNAIEILNPPAERG